MKLGQGGLSTGIRRSGGFSAGGSRFSTAPQPTVAPVMASQPAVYGGPPGSFITKGRTCPPGYSMVPLSRGEYRCIPRVAAAPAPKPAPAPPPAPPVTVSPTITVSPVMQQEFSPQFSPVLQQTQDSPGATQAAAPVQTSTPTQAARGGAPVAPSTPPGGTALAPLPTIPEPAPVTPAPTIPVGMPEPAPMAADSGWPVTPEMHRAIMTEREKGLPMGLILAAAGIGLFLMTRKPSKGKAK